MIEGYNNYMGEGHDLEPYRELFEHAREYRDCIYVHAGFIPRSYARMLMKEGEEVAVRAAKEKGYI